MDFESIAGIIFVILLIAVLYINRKKLTIQKLFYPVLYFIMYKTRIGIRLMDRIAKKHAKALYYISYFMIFVGFAGMALTAFFLVKQTLLIFTTPSAIPAGGIVLPVQAKGIFYVPFFYWIISIFILAVSHEFSHGVMARLHKVRIKSSGFAFLSVLIPVIPAAFVEPDEKKLAKKKPFQQLGVFAAGSFANLVIAGIIFLIFTAALPGIGNAMYENNGVAVAEVVKGYPAELSGMSAGEIIQQVDSTRITQQENFSALMLAKKPGDTLRIVTDKKAYNITLSANPQNKSKAYIGINVMQSTITKPAFVQKFGRYADKIITWVIGLFWWLFNLNLGIGLMNLAPLGPLDGGRMLLIALQKYMPQQRAEKIWKIVSLVFLLILIVNIGFGFVR